MNTLPHPSRPRAALCAALAMALTLVPAARAAAAAPPAAPAPAARPVTLAETRPVETTLGNPAIPVAHEVWLEMIRGAQHTLDFEEMYCSAWPGEPTDDLLAAIGAAAKRGVKVRLLLDASMHKTYPQPGDSLGTVPGVSVRTIDVRKIAGGIQHAKFFMADGEQVYLGSQNFDWRSFKHIHELGVRVRDPRLAAFYADVFELDWQVAGEQIAGRDSTGAGLLASWPRQAGAAWPLTLIQSKGDTVRLWPSVTPRPFIPDTTRWDRDAIVRLLDSARREIAIQIYSYAIGQRERRDDTIDLALRRAAGRGVSVKLLVSDWEADNARIGDVQALSTLPNVETRMSSIPEWTQGYIPFARVEHCKYMVVDSLWTWVGTDNWEPSYFHSVRNVALTMENRAIALEARRSFENSWSSPITRVVRAGEHYEPRLHGMTPPPGHTLYGN
jgi:phosphatidylserine/phosphatidylglycerophosphate/cardiolipin synthase-like enzyme